jgi:hypothetical protein
MMEYKVVGTGSRHFERDVNKLLIEGWELYGEPFSADSRLFQAMVKHTVKKIKKK